MALEKLGMKEKNQRIYLAIRDAKLKIVDIQNECTTFDECVARIRQELKSCKSILERDALRTAMSCTSIYGEDEYFLNFGYHSTKDMIDWYKKNRTSLRRGRKGTNVNWYIGDDYRISEKVF